MIIPRPDLETHWIRLPATVNEKALDLTLGLLARAGGRVRTILDFEATGHIEFRAFQRFADRLRELDQIARPVVLTGLSPYCTQIVRFALRPSDWDLFGVPSAVAEAGQGVPAPLPRRRERTEGAGWAPWNFERTTWTPHLN